MNSFFEMKVDALGRVTIPSRVRRVLNIERNETVIMNYDMEKLEVRKKDTKLIDNCIHNILSVADNSEDLTITAYRQLQDILAKLQK